MHEVGEDMVWVRYSYTRNRNLWPNPSISPSHHLPPPPSPCLHVGFILGRLKLRKTILWGSPKGERGSRTRWAREGMEGVDDLGGWGIQLPEHFPVHFFLPGSQVIVFTTMETPKEQQPGLILHVCTSYPSWQVSLLNYIMNYASQSRDNSWYSILLRNKCPKVFFNQEKNLLNRFIRTTKGTAIPWHITLFRAYTLIFVTRKYIAGMKSCLYFLSNQANSFLSLASLIINASLLRGLYPAALKKVLLFIGAKHLPCLPSPVFHSCLSWAVLIWVWLDVSSEVQFS